MFKFLHLADLHLGAEPSSFGALAKDRANDYLEAFERAIEYAVNKKNGINAILIVGDLFDVADPPQNVVRFVIEQLKRLKRENIPVIVTPGNHDAIGASNSIYSDQSICSLMHVIRSPQVEYFDTMVFNGEAVHFYGMAWDIRSKPPFDRFRRNDEDGYHIALIHGTLIGGLFSEGHSREVPLDLNNLANSGMNYIALGHIHNFQEKDAGTTTVVYPGTLESRRLTPGEKGKRFLIEVRLDHSKKASINNFKWNKKTYITEELDLDQELIETEDELVTLIQSKYASIETILRINLVGNPPFVIDVNRLITKLSGDFYWLKILDNTNAFNSLLVESWLREETIRGLFARKLKEKLDSTDSEDEKQKFQLALKLACQALKYSSQRK
jgi:exonuclease SbcD